MVNLRKIGNSEQEMWAYGIGNEALEMESRAKIPFFNFF
jgi:hypothetical protein